MPENQSSNTALATFQLHHKKSRHKLSSITPITSSKRNVFSDGSKDFRGAEVTLFKAIADHLNFDYIIREPQMCCGFGAINTGIRGEMTFGLSDVGWSQLYFTQSRWQQHDITTSYDEDQACLMVN